MSHIQEVFKASVVERMIQVDYMEFYRNTVTWNSVALTCLGFTCYLPCLSNPVFMERKKKESDYAQSCLTLCDPMYCPSMAFPRQESGVGCYFLFQCSWKELPKISVFTYLYVDIYFPIYRDLS